MSSKNQTGNGKGSSGTARPSGEKMSINSLSTTKLKGSSPMPPTSQQGNGGGTGEKK